MKEITKKSFYTGEEKDCGIWSRQCNICLATNYNNDGRYTEVNVIHEFNFNKMLVYMCDDCVKKLSTMTNLIIEDNFKKIKKSERVEENDKRFLKYLLLLKNNNLVKPFELYDMENADVPYALKEKYLHCIHQGYVTNSDLDDFYDIYDMCKIDLEESSEDIIFLYESFKKLYDLHKESTLGDLEKLIKYYEI